MSDVMRLLQRESEGLAASSLMEQIAPVLDEQLAQIDRRIAEAVNAGTFTEQQAMSACLERLAVFRLVRKLAAQAQRGRAATAVLSESRSASNP